MVVIDEEFKNLIPPLSDEEFRQLEENCVRDGIRDPLVVWPQEDGTDILIDGHNRWKIIGKHYNSLCPLFKRMEFESREDAKEWIIRNQLGRRNIQNYVKAELVLRLKPSIAEKAQERKLAGKSNLDQKSVQGRTYEKLADISGLSHDTIHRAERIQKDASEEEKQALRRGETSINKVYSDLVAAENEDRRQREARELREAKSRARDYQVSDGKVANFGDAKQHKDDNELIFNEFKEEVRKMYSNILSVLISAENPETMGAIQTANRRELIALNDKISEGYRTYLKLQRKVVEVLDEK